MLNDANSQERLEQRLAGLMKLVEITCELAGQHDLDQILKTVTTGVCEALECERASLFLHDEAAGELYTRTVTELEIREIRFPSNTGIGGWVMDRGRVEDGDFETGPPLEMQPGDLLLLATDGAVEVTNQRGELFGVERLKQLVRDNRDRPAGELVAVLRQAIDDFHPRAAPPDDVTLLVIERRR